MGLGVDAELDGIFVSGKAIDPSQQRAFAADRDSLDLTINTQLTQGDATATQPSDASTLTGNTRESKVKRAVIEVTKQFHQDWGKEAIAQVKMQSKITRLCEALAQVYNSPAFWYK